MKLCGGRKIFTRKAASDQDYFEEVERYTRECHGHWEEKPDPVGGYAIADPSAWSGRGPWLEMPVSRWFWLEIDGFSCLRPGFMA